MAKSGWDAPLTDWTIELYELSNKEIRKIAKEAMARIKMRTPVRTGELQAAWYMEQFVKEGIVEISIINDTEYAVFVEAGTHKMAGAWMVEQTLNEILEGTI